MVIRYEGPKGSPGMPEMLSPGAALVGAQLGAGRAGDDAIRDGAVARVARVVGIAPTGQAKNCGF